MTNTDPYAKLGGGALDQELFKKKTTPRGATIIGTKSCAKHHEEQSGRDATLKQQSGPGGVSEHNVPVFTLTAIGKPHTSSEC
jgi:hypothetical protein